MNHLLPSSLLERAAGEVAQIAGKVPEGRHEGAATGSDHHLLLAALKLVGTAKEILDRAVAYERSRGTSWEVIGELMGVRRQTAHGKFKDAEDRLLWSSSTSRSADPHVSPIIRHIRKVREAGDDL